MRRFLHPSLPGPGEQVILEPAAAHHLVTVLRLAPGDELLLFDGSGHQVTARLVGIRAGSPVVEGLSAATTARPAYPLHLVLGLCKGPAMDDAVRMATEAGLTHFHPALTQRSVARGDRSDRWRRIAASAAQQCGRADVPAVSAPLPLAEALAALPLDLDRRVAVPGARILPPAAGPAAVLVGPEGGLTEAEIAEAIESGMRSTGLGRWTLRAHTAAVVALGLIAPRD